MVTESIKFFKSKKLSTVNKTYLKVAQYTRKRCDFHPHHKNDKNSGPFSSAAITHPCREILYHKIHRVDDL